jgi:glutamine synthetase
MSDRAGYSASLCAAESDVDFLEAVEQADVDFVDLRFTDLPGRWHHVTLPISRFDARVLAKGVGFDGSSVEGYKSVERGDMVLIPDRRTATIDEVDEQVVLSLIASAAEAESRRPFRLDPRVIASQAEAALRQPRYEGVSLWSPELEFYLFSSVEYGHRPNASWYRVGSHEAGWLGNDDLGARLGHRIQPGAGYHASPPCDQHFDLRNEIVVRMQDAGIPVKYHHHENGAAGQMEVEILAEPLVQSADHVMLGKHIIRNTAAEWEVAATFMPKPIAEEAGSGLHFHVKLQRAGKPLFHDENGYAGLSQEALLFVGGILAHGRALAAITNPSTNSYRRLRPGYEAPTSLFFSAGNRSAAIRIPRYATEPDTKTVEYRPPDATANPYLAMAALLAAGLDGLARGIDPRQHGFGPFDTNMHDERGTEAHDVVPLPSSLEEALGELEKDNAFLTESGAFPEEFVSTWVDLKRREIDAVRAHPHPAEYTLYFDC